MISKTCQIVQKKIYIYVIHMSILPEERGKLTKKIWQNVESTHYM